MIAAYASKTSFTSRREANSMMAFCINGKSKSLSELFICLTRRWINVLKRCAVGNT